MKFGRFGECQLTFEKLEQNELKTDAKIDMLHRSGLFASPVKRQIVHCPPSEISEEEGNVEMSLVSRLFFSSRSVLKLCNFI